MADAASEAAPALAGGTTLRLHESATLVGCYRWVEHRLFELTGSWAPEAATPAVQLHLDEVSIQHAWHADLFSDRLPVLDGVDPAALTVPCGPVAGPLLAAVAASAAAVGGAEGDMDDDAEDDVNDDDVDDDVEDADDDADGDPDDDTEGAEDDTGGDTGSVLADVARLTALYRVLVPRLLTSYDRHLGRAAPVTDAPLIRALRLVLRDELETWLAGESLVQELVVTPEAARVASETQARLESLTLEVPGGIVAWPK